MHVVPITREQFPEWYSLRQALFDDMTDAEHRDEMQRFLAADDVHCFLAIVGDGEAVGMLEMSLRNLVDGCAGRPVGYIEGLYVRPDSRDRGIGRRLVEFAENWCRERGCREMATDAELSNTAAQAFHRHMGFEETWRIVEFRKRLSRQVGTNES